MIAPKKRLLRIKEAADELSVSRSKIYELIESGELKVTTVLPVRVIRESLEIHIIKITPKD